MSQAAELISSLSPIAIALISGPVLWGGLQHVLTRRKRKKDRRQEEDAAEHAVRASEREQQERRIEWRELLAEAQATEQRTSLEAADSRYKMLKDDFVEARAAVVGLREAVWALIDLVDTMLFQRLRPAEDVSDGSKTYELNIALDELGEARRTVNEARQRLR